MSHLQMRTCAIVNTEKHSSLKQIACTHLRIFTTINTTRNSARLTVPNIAPAIAPLLCIIGKVCTSFFWVHYSRKFGIMAAWHWALHGTSSSGWCRMCFFEGPPQQAVWCGTSSSSKLAQWVSRSQENIALTFLTDTQWVRVFKRVFRLSAEPYRPTYRRFGKRPSISGLLNFRNNTMKILRGKHSWYDLVMCMVNCSCVMFYLWIQCFTVSVFRKPVAVQINITSRNITQFSHFRRALTGSLLVSVLDAWKRKSCLFHRGR